MGEEKNFKKVSGKSLALMWNLGIDGKSCSLVFCEL